VLSVLVLIAVLFVVVVVLFVGAVLLFLVAVLRFLVALSVDSHFEGIGINEPADG
jgi:hypothetical protein